MHDQAIAIKEKLASEFPTNSDYRSELGASLHSRANTLGEANTLGDRRSPPAPAKGHKDQGAALRGPAAEPNISAIPGEPLGDVDRVFAPTRRSSRSRRGRGRVHRASTDKVHDSFFAAVYLARCVKLAESDSTLSKARRPS